MSVASSQLEEVLITLERTYIPLPALEQRIIALEQSLAAIWMLNVPFSSTCTATITGTLLGCQGTGLVSTTVTITDLAGLTLATTTTGSGGSAGQFSVAVTIPVTGQAVKVVISVAGFVSLVTTTTLSCGTNALGNLTPSVDTGYVCVWSCNIPLPQSLTVTWSGTAVGPAGGGFPAGAGVATYLGFAGGVYSWALTVNLAVAASGTCPATTVATTFTLKDGVGGFQLVKSYPATGVGCPTGGFTRTLAVTAGATTCPPGLSIAGNILAPSETITWTP